MDVPGYVWLLTVVGIVAMLLFDFIFHVRKAHSPTLKEAAIWSSLYVGIAILFGLGVWILGGQTMGAEYFAGYVTEKALSVDNLFVFLIIMTSFAVPRADQQKVLLFGIVFALIARTGFIFLGAALINQFAWVFYLFGLILLLTAGNMLKPEGEESHSARQHHGADRPEALPHHRPLRRRQTRHGRERQESTDPDGARHGRHRRHRHLVRARLGPRHLRPHRERLHRLHRHRVLSARLAAAVLPYRRPAGPAHLPQLRACRDPRFIGIKLILHALHENNVPFINGGEPVDVVEISTGLSLSVIIGVLLVTVVASLISPKGRAQNAVANARRHARQYLDLSYEADQRLREKTFEALLQEEQIIRGLPEKYRRRIRDEHELIDLLHRAHTVKDQRVAAGYGSGAAKADG